jgi:5-deoxy-glucuronate isomerase
VSAYRGEQLRFDVASIGAGETLRIDTPPNDEAVIVLLEGEVEWLGVRASRPSVFAQRASAVYLPPACTVEAHAFAMTEVAVATTVAGGLIADGEPMVVDPSDITVEQRGQPGWQREVHEVVGDSAAAQRLLVGETFNAPGQWSSYPPHKHDGRDGEPALEEVYHYRFDRPDGFGFQGLYDGNDERAVFLRHGAVVGFAAGYHPVCAAPGYRLYYLWALAGPVRRLAMHEDPAHRWLTEA